EHRHSHPTVEPCAQVRVLPRARRASALPPNRRAFDLDSTVPCSPMLGCLPSWSMTLATTPVAVPPAVAAGHVFVPETVVVAPTADVEVFDAAGTQSCGGAPRVCTPLFRLVTGSSAQGVAATASLAFVSTTGTQLAPAPTLKAYDLAGVNGCSGTPGACQPLKSLVLPSGIGFPFPPSVANGLVAVSGDGGGINVFAIPQ
ncbi:MAG: hypothetical protein ACXVIM_06355, partial [Acidimicrobiia bacterium]